MLWARCRCSGFPGSVSDGEGERAQGVRERGSERAEAVLVSRHK